MASIPEIEFRPPERAAADARRLVLGAAVGYTREQVLPFVRSLREVGFTGDAIMLVSPWQFRLKRYLARHGVATRPVVSTRRINGPIHAHRFEKFAKIVAANRPRYDEVLIADVRDVVFQKHPFAGIDSPACHFYLESDELTIGEEPTNLRWAKVFLPAAEVERLSRHRISCCGVVIGGVAAMAAYLDRLAACIHGVPPALRHEGGADTVFHNRIAHLTHEVPAVLVANNAHVATMGLAPPGAYVPARGRLIATRDGHVPAILHQYDRIPAIARAVAARFGM